MTTQAVVRLTAMVRAEAGTGVPGVRPRPRSPFHPASPGTGGALAGGGRQDRAPADPVGEDPWVDAPLDGTTAVDDGARPSTAGRRSRRSPRGVPATGPSPVRDHDAVAAPGDAVAAAGDTGATTDDAPGAARRADRARPSGATRRSADRDLDDRDLADRDLGERPAHRDTVGSRPAAARAAHGWAEVVAEAPPAAASDVAGDEPGSQRTPGAPGAGATFGRAVTTRPAPQALPRRGTRAPGDASRTGDGRERPGARGGRLDATDPAGSRDVGEDDRSAALRPRLAGPGPAAGRRRSERAAADGAGSARGTRDVTVEVSIGRIEVRLAPAAPGRGRGTPAAPPAIREGLVTLEEYGARRGVRP